VSCVPLVPLRAAAGAFGDPQSLDEDQVRWAEVDSARRLRHGMFVARVVGSKRSAWGVVDGGGAMCPGDAAQSIQEESGAWAKYSFHSRGVSSATRAWG